MNKIKILLVDDHKLLRETWAFVINSDPRFDVLGDTGSAGEAIKIAKNEKPDIIIMDINMQPCNGFEITEMILEVSPDSKVIALSMNCLTAYAKKKIAIGGYGYMTKNSPLSEMTKAILEVYNGNKFFSEEIRNLLVEDAIKSGKEKIPDLSNLSRREIEIIKYVKKGLSSKEIAADLNLSFKTVEVHRYNVLKKLSMKNTVSLINYLNLQVI